MRQSYNGILFSFFKVNPLILFTLIIFVGHLAGNAQLTTTRAGAYGKMPYLVNNVLLSNGLKATNITYQGIDTSFGLFYGKKSNIGMDSGIIITNGTITLADGPDCKAGVVSDGACTTYNYTTTDGWPSANTYNDSDLANLIGTTHNNTYSCARLEFDFVANSDSVEFQYVFGSNEWPHYVGSKYLDDFGSFLSGPGITGLFSRSAVNLAIFPRQLLRFILIQSTAHRTLHIMYVTGPVQRVVVPVLPVHLSLLWGIMDLPLCSPPRRQCNAE